MYKLACARIKFDSAQIFSVLAVTLLLAGCEGNSGPNASEVPADPVTGVSVTKISRQTVALKPVYPSRVSSINEVQVRSRVQGVLLERNYKEGALVQAGDLLFRIDSAPFEAQVQQAEAELQRSTAQLRQARRTFKRVSELFKENVISAAQRDDAESAVELAQAAVANAEAMLRTARIDLGYTRIEAPITGVAGLREVAEGNLMEPGDLLTTIQQLDPVHVLFSVPEAEALDLRNRYAAMGEKPIRVQLQSVSESFQKRVGTVDFLADHLDLRTGTLRMRAVVPNPDETLLPGQFVRVLVEGLELPDAIVIPPEAVLDGPQGQMVYLLSDDNTAEARLVVLGPVVDQGQVISRGLEAGETLIVNGIVSLRSGQPVKVMDDSVSKTTGGDADG